MIPTPTARLRFREMSAEDLDAMAGLLGDPRVMAFYPRPLSRAETGEWIARNRRRYAEHGHGLWIVETHDGAFVGDCGLTWQTVDGKDVLEVGYHVVPELQGRGYATEAAAACRDLAAAILDVPELTAIVHPDNAASRRVAERIGMVEADVERTAEAPRAVLGLSLAARRGPEAFLTECARLTDAHELRRLAPLIDPEAVYWFTDGSHRGRATVLQAIEDTFATIPDERYEIADVEWVSRTADAAVARYRFAWRGTVRGVAAEGAGRGTNVMVRRDGRWLMLHEHLST